MPHQIHPNPFMLHPPADLITSRPDLRRMASELASRYAEAKLVRDEFLKAIGSALWDALKVSPADLCAAIEVAGTAILPLVIQSSDAAVQALPWETLYHPIHGFLGKNPAFTLTRQLKISSAMAHPLAKGPLRVLLFTSLPDDVNETGRLKIEEEQAQVQEALLPWISKGVVRLEMPDDGRFATLQAMLKEFQPHLLFLSGHGQFHHVPHEDEAPYGAFFFEDDSGASVAVREDALANALSGSGVRVVVLSACESSKTAPASEALANGLAQRISAQGIAYVIGMRESIIDEAAIQFEHTLCDELAHGERIDFALQAARVAMQNLVLDTEQTSATEDLGQWCLPLLISNDTRQQVIDWCFDPTPPVLAQQVGNTLGAVLLPARFIGRRSEMRQYKKRLQAGDLKNLLITGPGGQGKTSLAGTMARDMQARGWKVFAYGARLEKPWQGFLFEELQMALDAENSKHYDRFLAKVRDEAELAHCLFQLLLQQFDGRVMLFFDNLETLQDPATHGLSDHLLATWLAVACATPGLQVLITSRWLLPDWGGEHHPLTRANYGDFLQKALR